MAQLARVEKRHTSKGQKDWARSEFTHLDLDQWLSDLGVGPTMEKSLVLASCDYRLIFDNGTQRVFRYNAFTSKWNEEDPRSNVKAVYRVCQLKVYCVDGDDVSITTNLFKTQAPSLDRESSYVLVMNDGKKVYFAFYGSGAGWQELAEPVSLFMIEFLDHQGDWSRFTRFVDAETWLDHFSSSEKQGINTCAYDGYRLYFADGKVETYTWNPVSKLWNRSSTELTELVASCDQVAAEEPTRPFSLAADSGKTIPLSNILEGACFKAGPFGTIHRVMRGRVKHWDGSKWMDADVLIPGEPVPNPEERPFNWQEVTALLREGKTLRIGGFTYTKENFPDLWGAKTFSVVSPA